MNPFFYNSIGTSWWSSFVQVKRDDGKMRRRDLATGKYYIGAYSPIARIARVLKNKAILFLSQL